MKRDRLSFLAGFMPPMCMMILLAFGYLMERDIIGSGRYMIATAEILPFLIPFLLITAVKSMTGNKKGLRLGGFTRKAVPFVVFMSFTAALLSFLLNCLVSVLFERTPYQQVQYADGFTGVWTIVIVVLLPAIFEELLFRSGIISSYEQHGAAAAIVVSAVSFALVHGNPANFIGPLAAGLVYGYMTLALGSIWPAVIAHMINNAFFLLLGYMTSAYEALGFWPYFLLGAVAVFAIFLYLSMSSLSRLIAKGKAAMLKPGGAKGLATGVLISPGLWLLAIMFVIRVIYS